MTEIQVDPVDGEVRPVLCSVSALEALADRANLDLEWGVPDEQGFYTPRFREHVVFWSNEPL